jgi:sugar O-acyltransferase (sialic acid O-acetyltransferase NeuD family)
MIRSLPSEETNMRQVGVFGAGGFGREIAWIVEARRQAGGDEQLACYLDDAATPGQLLGGVPVLTAIEAKQRFPKLAVVCAVGTPKTRERIVEVVRGLGWEFYTAVHPGAYFRAEGVEIGEGSMICAGVVMTTDIKIGRHCTLNLGTTVGHDCVLGDFVTITPGVNLTGRVHIGRGAYIGIGANLVCRSTTVPLVIGEYATVGAGSVVLQDVADGTMVVGIPAVPKQSKRSS